MGVVIVGCVLAALGSCGGSMGVLGQLMQESLQGLSEQMVMGDEVALEQQRAMQRELEAVTERYQPAMLAQAALNVAGSLALGLGALLLLSWRRSGPAVFLGASLACLMIDAAGGALTAIVQLQTTAIVREQMVSMSSSNPELPPGFERTMDAAMQAGGSVGLCFAAAWFLLKAAYYVGGVIYVRKPGVRALFG